MHITVDSCAHTRSVPQSVPLKTKSHGDVVTLGYGRLLVGRGLYSIISGEYAYLPLIATCISQTLSDTCLSNRRISQFLTRCERRYKFARSASKTQRTVVRLSETTFAALVRDKSTNSYSLARCSINRSEPLDSAVVFTQLAADAVPGLMADHAYEPTRLMVYAASVATGCTVAAFSLAHPWTVASFAYSKLHTPPMAALSSAAMCEYGGGLAFSVAEDSELHVLGPDGPQVHKLGRAREAKLQVVAGASRCSHCRASVCVSMSCVQACCGCVRVCVSACTDTSPDRMFLSYLSDQRPRGFVPCIREVTPRHLTTFYIPRT